MTETLVNGQVVDLPFASAPATIGDFITAYGLREALELSYLDEPYNDSSDVNADSFNLALKDAYDTIETYRLRASSIGKAAIVASTRRAMLIIARHYLDVVRRRTEVRADFEDVLEILEDIVCGCNTKDLSSILDVTFADGTAAVQYTVQPRVFTNASLSNFRDLRR